MQDNAQNRQNWHITGSGLKWDLVMTSLIAKWLMKRNVPSYSQDGWVSIYVIKNKINDDGFF